eukprot:s918_g5.t1
MSFEALFQPIEGNASGGGMRDLVMVEEEALLNQQRCSRRTRKVDWETRRRAVKLGLVGCVALFFGGHALQRALDVLRSIGETSPFILLDEAPKCEDFPSLDFLWVAHNNLGNKGPDYGEEGLVYRVRHYNGREMEMVFNAMNDFREHDSKMFGMHGKYGSLNVAELSQADLRVTFRDHMTKQPIILDHVAMTFYDIDQGPSSMGIEEVEVEGDWTLALVSKNSGIKVDHSPHLRKIRFSSTMEGMAMDSPMDPMTLTMVQFEKAVTLKFEHTDSFRVRLAVRNKGTNYRFFEFAGRASMVCARLPDGAPAPVGEVFANPMEHDPPGLVAIPPYETAAATAENKWMFQEWLVHEGQKVRPGDPIFRGKWILGEEVKENQVLRTDAEGTVTQLLTKLRPGHIIQYDVNVAIIAYKVIRPPGITPSLGGSLEASLGLAAFNVEMKTRHTYQVSEWKASENQAVEAGDVIFIGHLLKRNRVMDREETFVAPIRGTITSLLKNVKPGNFIKNDVAVGMITPRTIPAPGLQADPDAFEMVVPTRDQYVRWDGFFVKKGDEIKKGQLVGAYFFMQGRKGTRRGLKAGDAGIVQELLDIQKGDILEPNIHVVLLKRGLCSVGLEPDTSKFEQVIRVEAVSNQFIFDGWAAKVGDYIENGAGLWISQKPRGTSLITEHMGQSKCMGVVTKLLPCAQPGYVLSPGVGLMIIQSKVHDPPGLAYNPELWEMPIKTRFDYIFHTYKTKPGKHLEAGRNVFFGVRYPAGASYRFEQTSLAGRVKQRLDPVKSGEIIRSGVTVLVIGPDFFPPPGLQPRDDFEVAVKTDKKYALHHWMVQEGDKVDEGAKIVAVRTWDGHKTFLHAPKSGVVTAVLSVLKHNDVIDTDVGLVLIKDTTIHTSSTEAVTTEKPHASSTESLTTSTTSTPERIHPPGVQPRPGHHEIGLNTTNIDVFIAWHKAPGDWVDKGEVVATVEEDGKQVQLLAPAGGKVHDRLDEARFSVGIDPKVGLIVIKVPIDDHVEPVAAITTQAPQEALPTSPPKDKTKKILLLIAVLGILAVLGCVLALCCWPASPPPPPPPPAPGPTVVVTETVETEVHGDLELRDDPNAPHHHHHHHHHHHAHHFDHPHHTAHHHHDPHHHTDPHP